MSLEIAIEKNKYMKNDIVSPESLMQVGRKTTHRQYLFGDFDRDGVKNVDDYRPFDPKISAFPDPNKNPRFYHKAQYGGFDTRFSDVLLKIERSNNRNVPLLKTVLRENPGSKGRIKTVPSTIGKMYKKSYHVISDIAGAEVLVHNRRQVRQKVKSIKRKHKHNPKETDDFYKRPLKNVYYAYHIGLVKRHKKYSREKQTLEVQIKTPPMKELHVKMHKTYKSGGNLTPYRKEARRLFKLGF